MLWRLTRPLSHSILAALTQSVSKPTAYSETSSRELIAKRT
jgi:hypothetical protein